MNKINIASLRKSLKLRQKDFGEKIGIKQAYLSEIESGKKPLTEELYNNIVNVFGIEKVSEYFVSNEASDNIAKANISEAIPLNQSHIINVPLVSQYAQAGYLCGYQDAAYMETLPTIPFIIDHRLLCREIYSQYWVESKLHYTKWDFVIVHEEGILVKRIIDHNMDNHTITIHSLNSMYPDRVIDLAEVKQIFNVIELQRPRRR